MQYQPNKALTQWLNRCIPMEDNTMYCTIYEWYLTDNLNYQANTHQKVEI